MEELIVRSKPLGNLGTNCYFLVNSKTQETIIVDPAAEKETIVMEINKYGYKPVAILLTHGHFDHMLAASQIRQIYGIKIYAMAEEFDLLADANQNLSMNFMWAYTMKADVAMQDNERLNLNGMDFKVLHTPGHTRGSCCFYFENQDILISGDTLFCCSVGRTDFPTGSTSALYDSIQRKLLVLPERVKVYPGHGEETSIKEAKDFFAQYGY